MGRFRHIIGPAIFIVALSCSAFAASAQSQSPAPPAFSQTPPSSADRFSDKKLDAAAAALQRIASLRQDFRDQITKAVTDQGLSVDEYAEIIDTAQNDADVRQKILQRIRPKPGSQNGQ